MTKQTWRPLMASLALVLLLALTGCEASFSTANIESATLTDNPDGGQPVTTFAPDDTFYVLVDLANAPDDTVVSAAWTAVDVEGVDPNTAIDQADVTSGSGPLTFDLSNDNLWPAGTYKVDLYLNDELDQTIEFQVQE